MVKTRLSQREEQILLLLKRFDFLTRDQLNQYFQFGTVRNANYVLKKLSDYLMTIREGYQTIYYLNKEGREYVECNKVRKKSSQVQHIIMRNDFWFFCGCPGDWKNEVKISNGDVSVIADAVFTRNGFYHFLEVDRTQPMKENKAKIEHYKRLSESLVRNFNYYPTLIWLTTTNHRRTQLERLCNGLKVKVYTIDDIK